MKNLILILLTFFALSAGAAEVATIKEADAIKLAKQISKMKPAQWAALPAAELKLDATVQKTETGITVAPDDVYLIVPQPTDLWTQGPVAKYTKAMWNEGELPLKWFIGADAADATASPESVFVKGDGPLTIGHGDANAGDNWGFIRVKIFKVVKQIAKAPKK